MKIVIATFCLIFWFLALVVTGFDLCKVIFKGEPFDWNVLLAFIVSVVLLLLTMWFIVRVDKKKAGK